jgi:putative PIN family toxin of toxin-antitoxin system
MGKKKEKFIKVILDTNVLVSALLFKGDTARLVDLWKAGKIRPVFSRATFAEFRRVLDYPKFQLSSTEIEAIVKEDILPFFDVMEPVEEKIGFCRDPEDDKFAALAIASKADFLITGDDDLLCLKKIEKTHILKPAMFLGKMEGE